MAYILGRKKPTLLFPSVSGSVCNFNSQYAGLPLKSHKIAITATQSGSGTPSPDNVRTINGVSAINIGSDAKYDKFITWNQIYKYTVGNTTTLGVTRSITNGLITFSGETTGAGNGVVLAWSDFTIPNGHKVIVLKDFDLPDGDYIMDQYNGLYAYTDITNTILNISAGFLIPQVRVTGVGHDYTGISGHLSVIDLTVMFGSTIADEIYNMEQQTAGSGVAYFRSLFPNDYYDYNAGTLTTVSAVNGSTNSFFTINLGGTYYGGEYDARTGVLTATGKGTLARDVSGWAKSGNVFYRNFPDVWTAITPDTPTGRKPLLCSHFDYSSSSIVADLKVGYGGANNNGNIVIRYDALSTISDFNDYITNNDVFIVYPLATPQTIQLPPCPIDTLLGENNIWADTGDTNIQYIKLA